jgi:two-component system NtrC family sensor kinase
MPTSADRTGLAIVREVARALNQDRSPDETLQGVVDLLREGLGLAVARVWRREPSGSRVVAISAPPDGRTAESLAALPAPEPGGLRVPVARPGHQLGALDLVPAAGTRSADLSVGEAVAEVLAPFLDAVLLTEDLTNELALRARELQEQQRLNNLIIDSLPVGLYVVDRDYCIVVWNRKRETGTQGLRREQVLGRPVFEVLTRQADQLRAELDEIFEGGEVIQRELEVERTAEGQRTFRLTKIPMRLGGDAVTHVITIGEDITERRAAQDRILQSEKLAAIGQLAAGVMHEINNPLATIGACVAAIEARLVDAGGESAVHEYLEIIDTEVQRCTRIVDQLLDFSRPSASRSKRRAEDLNAIVAQTLFLLKHHSRFKRLAVERLLADDLPPALVDGERLVQAFMAIMINAADAMERGGTLWVRTGRSPQRADELVVEFEDTGPGIAPSDLGKIFEPFYTTKPPGRGTGLGLTICYGIVEEQSGRITVDSRPGLGTTFRIFLPVAPEASA